MRTKIFSLLVTLSAIPMINVSAALATAIEDAFVLAAQPDNVFDTELLLIKRERNNGNVSRKVWIKFDLSSFNLAANTGATLNLKIGDPIANPSSPASHSINVYALNPDFTPATSQLGADWTDELLTFNNAPGNDSSFTGADLNAATLLGSFITQSSGPTSTPGTIYSFQFNDLASYIESTGSTITLILTTITAGDSNLRFASSENIAIAAALNNDADPNNDISPVTGPELEFSVVPEPASAGLLIGLAALGLARIRRRR